MSMEDLSQRSSDESNSNDDPILKSCLEETLNLNKETSIPVNLPQAPISTNIDLSGLGGIIGGLNGFLGGLSKHQSTKEEVKSCNLPVGVSKLECEDVDWDKIILDLKPFIPTMFKFIKSYLNNNSQHHGAKPTVTQCVQIKDWDNYSKCRERERTKQMVEAMEEYCQSMSLAKHMDSRTQAVCFMDKMFTLYKRMYQIPTEQSSVEDKYLMLKMKLADEEITKHFMNTMKQLSSSGSSGSFNSC
jgi:hypothetical protein